MWNGVGGVFVYQRLLNWYAYGYVFLFLFVNCYYQFVLLIHYVPSQAYLPLFRLGHAPPTPFGPSTEKI